MKYYYYLDNKRYISDKLYLDKCINIRFKLKGQMYMVLVWGLLILLR